jgi:isocitrate dehydrogenase
VPVTQTDILELYKRMTKDFKVSSIELLNMWGGKKAYTLAQGQ